MSDFKNFIKNIPMFWNKNFTLYGYIEIKFKAHYKKILFRYFTQVSELHQVYYSFSKTLLEYNRIIIVRT